MPRHPESPFTDHHGSHNSGRSPEGPLTCETAAVLLEPHADGELTGEPLAALTAHLERCPACREELESAREVAESLRGLPTLTCPPSVTEAVLAAAAKDAAQESRASQEPLSNVSPFQAPQQTTQKASRRAARFWRPALAAAMLAAAIGAAFWIQDRTTPSQEELAHAAIMTPEEIAQTEIEVKLALAYLTEVGRDAGVTVRDEMVANVVLPTHRALR